MSNLKIVWTVIEVAKGVYIKSGTVKSNWKYTTNINEAELLVDNNAASMIFKLKLGDNISSFLEYAREHKCDLDEYPKLVKHVQR